jgi:hypothetical protein
MTSVSPLSSALTSGTAASALTGTSATTADSSLASALAGNTTDPLAAAASGGTTSSSPTDSIADSTSKALQQISDQIAALGASNAASAASNVQEFEKTTNDVLYDNNATARSIGQLRLNTTRLNVVSALSPKDNIDTFTFTASTPGATKLGLLVNDPSAADQTADASGDVHVQIFAKGKGLVADSDPNAGTAYQNYQALKAGTYNMDRGDYTIRVTRADGVDAQSKNTYNYAIQLTQGDKYTQDYTVTEQAYDPSSNNPLGVGAYDDNSPAAILSGSMSDAYNFISQLGPIGQTGTSKLLGFIYTTSV